MSDKLEDDMDNTVHDVMKAIEIREDIEERGQTNEVVLAIFFKLYDEQRILELEKKKQTNNSNAFQIAQIKLDFVNELLNIDGLKELGERLAEKASESEGKRRPGDLSVTVDDLNETVVVSARGGKQTKYTRADILGKGTVTWPLLVAFAKCGGSLEGNTAADMKKINRSANRNNLGKKLVGAMKLDESPIIEGRNGAMRFRSIQLAGGTSSPDALDRKTTDDQTTEFLQRHGDDIPVD